MLEKRQLGRTRLQVTTLGLGTATMGGSRIPITQAEGQAIVAAAWDAGVRYVDTAPFYGVGAAEHRVGDALRDKDRDAWVLSTKVGRLLRPKTDTAPSPDGRLSPMPFKVVYDYTYDGIMRSVEDSYQRLGLARIDILYVHDIGVYQHGPELNAHLCETTARQRLQGARRTAPHRRGQRHRHRRQREGNPDRGDGLRRLGRLPAGRPLYAAGAGAAGRPDPDVPVERGTSLVIGGPLNSGILAGRDTWNYDKAPPEIVARVQKIAAVCKSHNVPLPAAALQFPLAHPVVAAVIPGPRNAAEFNENLPLFTMKIPPGLWSDLRAENLLHPERADAGLGPMPIYQTDPWRVQFFEHAACPDDVIIPTKDWEAWPLYPNHRWIYDKLAVALSQGLDAAPHGVIPPHFPVFSKPMMNLRSMGAGSLPIPDLGDLSRLDEPWPFLVHAADRRPCQHRRRGGRRRGPLVAPRHRRHRTRRHLRLLAHPRRGDAGESRTGAAPGPASTSPATPA